METKRNQARNFIAKGDNKRALRIAKVLDATYSKDEVRILEIAYECLTGKDSFYRQLGINVEENKAKAFELLERLNQTQQDRIKGARAKK